MVEIHDLRVPAEHAVVPRVPVDPGAHVPGLAVVPIDIGPREIDLEGPRDNHARSLQLEAAVPLIGNDAGTRTLEVIELADVILTLERPALVLDARIERAHLVAQFIDIDPGSEDAGREDHRAVRV